jgi:hypothetical protein
MKATYESFLNTTDLVSFTSSTDSFSESLLLFFVVTLLLIRDLDRIARDIDRVSRVGAGGLSLCISGTGDFF